MLWLPLAQASVASGPGKWRCACRHKRVAYSLAGRLPAALTQLACALPSSPVRSSARSITQLAHDSVKAVLSCLRVESALEDTSERVRLGRVEAKEGGSRRGQILGAARCVCLHMSDAVVDPPVQQGIVRQRLVLRCVR
jgi:hypothetical protein